MSSWGKFGKKKIKYCKTLRVSLVMPCNISLFYLNIFPLTSLIYTLDNIKDLVFLYHYFPE